MYSSLYESFYNHTRGEGFNGSNVGGDIFASVFAILGVVLIFVVQLFVVKFLWNSVLVRVLSIARPIPSVVDALGLMILVSFLFPSSILA